MPTISQLPSADTVSASDLIPISQGGSAHSVSVGALLAQTQPAIMVAPPTLLGRVSIGPGGPDTILVGGGLTLNGGTLSANLDLGSLSVQTTLSPADQIVVTNAGTQQLLELDQIRDLFTAGTNIAIDLNGVISASTYGLTALSTVVALASADLVGVSQGGEDHAISYGDFLDGVTIDAAEPAGAATDTDAFWVAQTSNVMMRQTLGTLWPWLSGKLPGWTRPVLELSTNTTLNAAVHNNSILVCSAPILISAQTAGLASGFSCEIINACSGAVAFSSNIVTSNGSSGLSPCQSGTVLCVTYSGGTIAFASIAAGSSATAAPGQPLNLLSAAVTSASITLSWSAPNSGGTVLLYSIQYRITGTIPWLTASPIDRSQTFTIGGLHATTSYDFTVTATNNIGTGPISSILTAITAT
jgi:hypothetical protein